LWTIIKGREHPLDPWPGLIRKPDTLETACSRTIEELLAGRPVQMPSLNCHPDPQYPQRNPDACRSDLLKVEVLQDCRIHLRQLPRKAWLGFHHAPVLAFDAAVLAAGSRIPAPLSAMGTRGSTALSTMTTAHDHQAKTSFSPNICTTPTFILIPAAYGLCGCARAYHYI
jgi:hypothetical protein